MKEQVGKATRWTFLEKRTDPAGLGKAVKNGRLRQRVLIETKLERTWHTVLRSVGFLSTHWHSIKGFEAGNDMIGPAV